VSVRMVEIWVNRKQKAHPMASRVSAHVVREDMAAACKLGASHWKMLLSPVSEVVNPTTPQIRDKITKKPVVMFPIGKYIGNIRAGRDKTDATIQTTQSQQTHKIQINQPIQHFFNSSFLLSYLFHQTFESHDSLPKKQSQAQWNTTQDSVPRGLRPLIWILKPWPFNFKHRKIRTCPYFVIGRWACIYINQD